LPSVIIMKGGLTACPRKIGVIAVNMGVNHQYLPGITFVLIVIEQGNMIEQ